MSTLWNLKYRLKHAKKPKTIQKLNEEIADIMKGIKPVTPENADQIFKRLLKYNNQTIIKVDVTYPQKKIQSVPLDYPTLRAARIIQAEIDGDYYRELSMIYAEHRKLPI